MAFFLRQGVIAVSLGTLLFCISCEKHPLGQLPEVQREQPDPAKVWSNATKKNSDESSASPTPAEFSPHEAR
ncbi:MAG: hypothetical protein DME61_06700 [Verrucomicrobia bacterium]|jgi:hypothetical protein|nr:MAG: hypothetical protein DME61_06700 [Verrucomicrobiota bacterium]PYL69014.1 MAG: hypothetical protein DMF28_04740 [Verrucomicrobiota bacterium]